MVSLVHERIFGSSPPRPEVLQDAESEYLPAAAMLPGQLERVTGSTIHSTVEQVTASVVATNFTHMALLRFEMRDVLVSRDGFAAVHHSQRFSRGLFRSALTKPVVEVDRLQYCITSVSRLYFGHWLTDALPTAMIDVDGFGMAWAPSASSWTDTSDYRNVLGLADTSAELIFARRFVFYLDLGQGSHKRQRYALVRQVLRSRYGGSARPVNKVYLSRGTTGVQRLIQDEAKLIEQLRGDGWLILEIGKASVSELQAALCSANIVVSMEGSHIAHAQMSLMPGSVLVALCPQDQFTAAHLEYGNANRISVGFVVLDRGRNGYVVNWDDVERTIELASRRAELLPPPAEAQGSASLRWSR